MNTILDHYGYAAVFIGTILEGETILVLAGFAAHRGYMGIEGVIAAAFMGSLFGDQAFYYLGRSRGRKFLESRPQLKSRVDKVQRLLDRYRDPLVIGFRFLYGLRAAVPLVMGMSRFPAPRFLALNALGALIWAILVGLAGYLFGLALEALMGDIRRYETAILMLIGLVGASVWGLHFYRRSREKIPLQGE